MGMGCGGQKRTAFSVHARPTDKEQPFLSAAKLQLPTAPKLTCNSPFRIPLATVSLQYNNPFFENSQSCVSTKVTLSHRFKSSPAISGKFAIPGAAGYLMNAGHFRQNLESNGDLNRPRESRGSQPSACFCGTFCTPQKVPTRTPLPGVSRFCKPRFSSPQWRLRIDKIKFFAAPRPFRRPWRHPFGG